MHGILALGANHLGYLRPNQRKAMSIAATHHYHLALTGYRAALAAITPENCHACAAFSLLLSVFAWACPDRPGTLFLPEPQANEVELIAILRGGNSVMAASKDIIVQGPLGPLYTPWFGWNRDPDSFTRLPSVQSLLQRNDTTPPVLPHEEDARLEQLSQIWGNFGGPGRPTPPMQRHLSHGSPHDLPSPISPAYHQSSHGAHSPAAGGVPFNPQYAHLLTPSAVAVLEHTLKMLRRVYVVATTNNIIEPQVATLSWPIVIPDAFIEMVQAHNPYALVLLAHYCILLKRNDSRWWIEGKAEELLTKIRTILDREWGGEESWAIWLQWPVGEVGERATRSERGSMSRSVSVAHSLAGSQAGTPSSMPGMGMHSQTGDSPMGGQGMPQPQPQMQHQGQMGHQQQHQHMPPMTPMDDVRMRDR